MPTTAHDGVSPTGAMTARVFVTTATDGIPTGRDTTALAVYARTGATVMTRTATFRILAPLATRVDQ
jgi:hypothetical protein